MVPSASKQQQLACMKDNEANMKQQPIIQQPHMAKTK